MFRQNYWLCISLFATMAICSSVSAQTYSSPELQRQATEAEQKKLNYIKTNPEAYKAQGGDPSVLGNNSSSTTATPITYASPVNLLQGNLYKLVAIKAIDINHKHSEAEMKGFNDEALAEFAKLNIVIDWEQLLWYYIPRDTHKEPATKQFEVVENKLLMRNCKECQSSELVIVSQSSTSLIVQVKPQDEGQFFVYQFEFKK